MLFILMMAAVVLGVAAAITGTPPQDVMQPLLGTLLIAAGLFSGLAAHRERVLSRSWRIRQALLAGLLVTWGSGLLAPAGSVRLALQVVSFALVAASLVLILRSRAARRR